MDVYNLPKYDKAQKTKCLAFRNASLMPESYPSLHSERYWKLNFSLICLTNKEVYI